MKAHGFSQCTFYACAVAVNSIGRSEYHFFDMIDRTGFEHVL